MKLLYPPPYRYAVIQMDPVAMVKHFEDPIATAAAAATQPKKYLVYLELMKDLCTPPNPWFRYKISPIATTLRAEEPEKGITADMVLPIFPNTYHPGGYRPPIHTHPPFPFSNCYHWIDNSMDVRIRRKAARYDDSRAYRLDLVQQAEVDKGFYDDHTRIRDFLVKKYADAEGNPPLNDSGLADSHSTGDVPHERRSTDSADEGINVDDVDSLPEGPHDPDGTDPTSESSHCSEVSSDDSMAAIIRMDLLGFHVDDTVELMPLVDLWFELTDHLSEETIPSPLDLCKERDTIMQIIHDARERAPSTRQLPIDSGVAVDYGDLSSVDEITTQEFLENEFRLISPEKREEYGIRLADSTTRVNPHPDPEPSGIWRSIRRRVREVALRLPIPWRFHPPCLPCWS